MNNKDVNNIIKTGSIKDLLNVDNKEVVYVNLSKGNFLNSVNLDTLSLEELILIKEALDYSTNLYFEKAKAIGDARENGKISTKEYLIRMEGLVKDYTIINKYSPIIMESIAKEQEVDINTKKLIRSSGFLTIDMLYILSFIITIITIITLIKK